MAVSTVESLSNPLATIEQLSQSASLLDGLPDELIDSIRYQGCILTQSAGVLLRLPQAVIAEAIVTLIRFYTGPEGGSFRFHAVKDFSAACLYLTAKSSATPITTRSLLNVYNYLLSSASILLSTDHDLSNLPPDGTSYTLTPAEYASRLQTLQQNETFVLRTLGFVTRTVLPHGLALTYLSTLGQAPSSSNPSSRALTLRVLALLNTALLSPQCLYVTHQPHALAVAAVYLAAKQVGTPLVGENGEGWWEVFDVDREELGFLCVGMLSVGSWVEREMERGMGVGLDGKGGRWVLGLQELEGELARLEEEQQQ